MKPSWLRIAGAIVLTPVAAALGAALFAGPLYSAALWNFAPHKGALFKLFAPAGTIALFGTVFGAAFSLLAALVTQGPLILLHRFAMRLSLPVHVAVTAGLGLALFWYLFPFPMGAPQGGWDPNADGGLLVPLLMGTGGGVGLALLWYWLVLSKVGRRA